MRSILFAIVMVLVITSTALAQLTPSPGGEPAAVQQTVPPPTAQTTPPSETPVEQPTVPAQFTNEQLIEAAVRRMASEPMQINLPATLTTKVELDNAVKQINAAIAVQHKSWVNDGAEWTNLTLLVVLLGLVIYEILSRTTTERTSTPPPPPSGVDNLA